MRVLVVEDDEGIAAGPAADLRRHGWAVDVARQRGAGLGGAARRALRRRAAGPGPARRRRQRRCCARLRQAPAGAAARPGHAGADHDRARPGRLAHRGPGPGRRRLRDQALRPGRTRRAHARAAPARRRPRAAAAALRRAGDRPGGAHGAARRRSRWNCRRASSRCCWRCWKRGRGCCRARRSRPSCTTGTSALDSNAIEVHVHHLRRKLGEGVIRTVRGVGYFVPAEPAAMNRAAPPPLTRHLLAWALGALVLVWAQLHRAGLQDRRARSRRTDRWPPGQRRLAAAAQRRAIRRRARRRGDRAAAELKATTTSSR